MKDVAGNELGVGDVVVFGADNGSSLMRGRVFKITDCFAWMHLIAPGGRRRVLWGGKPVTHKRWPSRVHVVGRQ